MSENPGKSAILAALADLSETISRTFGALETREILGLFRISR